MIGRDVPQRPDEDGETCEDKDDILALGDVFFGECEDKSEVSETGGVSCRRGTTYRAASLLKSEKYIFFVT